MELKTEYVIEGSSFSTLEQFYEEFGKKVLGGKKWGENLDAFNDVLYGGLGTPEEGFTLLWRDSQMSRTRLGYKETIRQLERQLAEADPINHDSITLAIQLAKAGTGQTVFDWIIEIIAEHPEIHLELL